MGERCRQVAGRLLSWLENAAESAAVDKISCLVTEWPQVYRAGKSKGDPNDLVPMAGVAGCLAGHLGVPVQSYLPAEWLGGTCPKWEDGDPWASPRGQRVWEALTAAERVCVVASHDAVDAVGIGLKYLGRFELRRLYVGSQ